MQGSLSDRMCDLEAGIMIEACELCMSPTHHRATCNLGGTSGKASWTGQAEVSVRKDAGLPDV